MSPRETTPGRAAAPEPAVRSHARGRRFWAIMLAPWPVAVAVGAAVSAVFGVGLAVAIGCGLAIALGIDFVWAVVVFAADDGEIDERVRRSLEGPGAPGGPPVP